MRKNAFENLPLPDGLKIPSALMGFQILMAVGKLTPLGDPAPNDPQWFVAVEMIRLAADMDWLHKATKEIAKYWRPKRDRRQAPAPSSHAALGITPSLVD